MATVWRTIENPITNSPFTVPTRCFRYATTSRTLPAPRSGKVAVKVINHYGDEIMQMYDVMARLPAPHEG